jgi:hypothetical protein
MNLSTPRQNISDGHKTDTSTVSMMKAIIIGNELAFAEKVHAILLRVGQQDRLQIHWAVKFWPLKALGEIALREQVLVEALEAHLIVLPAHLAQSPTHWLIAWLRRWAGQREVPDAALGLISDGGDDNFAQSLPLELSLLILEHGLDFITDPDVAIENQKRLAIDFSPEQEVPLPVAPVNFAEMRMYNSYRAMGINE